MQLPSPLRQAIDELAESADAKALRAAAARLTERYQAGTAELPAMRSAMRNEDERLAYLLVRLPATFAAASHALRAVRNHAPAGGFAVETMLDLGSGPGTAAWAALEVFPGLRKLCLVERDPALIRLGRQLAASGSLELAALALAQAEWVCSDLRSEFPEGSFDLVTASYALGELSPANQFECLRQAWARTGKLLVLVEAGTRAGFGHIHRARQELIAWGANLVAPCPHRVQCPMAASGDWCHFAARVERTSTHRRFKGGELGYEDEKFSYLAASRIDCAPAQLRIVRHPAYHSGLVELQLCSADELAPHPAERAKGGLVGGPGLPPQQAKGGLVGGPGLKTLSIGRTNKQLYRLARKAAWGDSWPPV